jgi:Uncharacterized conserved protein
MKKDYEVRIYTIETTNGIEYIAEFPDLKGCAGSGETPEEALREAYENKEIYIETLKELGRKLPSPSVKKDNFSGKLSLRMSSKLHQKINDIADEDGISTNQYIVETLAESVGSNMKVINMSKEKMKRYEEIIQEYWADESYFTDEFLFSKKISGGLN